MRSLPYDPPSHRERYKYSLEGMIEELYASPEVEQAFEQGKRVTLQEHRCPKVEIRTKIIERVRKPHHRSRSFRWGIVSNRKLLNPTFKSEAKAAVFISEGLRPVNPKYKGVIIQETFVVDLGSPSLPT